MKTIEEIIVEKEYNELTQEELNLVAELAENEQEYKAMRSLFAQMETEIIPDSAFVASDNTKKSLDSIFMAKYPVIAQDWKKEEAEEETKVIPFYNSNWFRAAAVLLLFSGASYYYFQSGDFTVLGEKKEQSLAIQVPLATTESPVVDEHSVSKHKSITKDVAVKPLEIMDEIQGGKADDASAEVAFEPVAVPMSTGAVAYSSSSSLKDAGMSADLNPNGVDGEMASNDSDLEGGSSEVTTEDMLGWIQTLY